MNFKSKLAAIILLLSIITFSACNFNKGTDDEAENTIEDSIEIAPLDTIAETEAIEETEEIKVEEDVKDTATVKKKKVIAKPKPLTLIIKNLRSSTAPVIVSIYGTENEFPEPTGQLKEYRFKPKSNVLTAKITDVPFGTYAVALYQDENSNGKIDKNLIGYPTEGFAFSNNFKPTVKAPSFKNCAFEYTKDANTITINMLH